MLNRREFLQAATAIPAIAATKTEIPEYRVHSKYPASPVNGLPGPYAGHVVRVKSARSVDEKTNKIDAAVVREMMDRGMRALTGDKDVRDSWARFFNAQDCVGIKINSSGAPGIMSAPEVVTEIAQQLISVGVKPGEIFVHERGAGQMATIHYPDYLPAGVRVESAQSFMGFDPDMYVEVNFFGEDDTRSHLLRMTSQKFTKIINVPNMKDHGAAGVTGCLKNLAYGEFNNVARSHHKEKTHTLWYIGTLVNTEPLKSKTVLHIMDGIRGIWHGGPFVTKPEYLFYPKEMMFGTDPVAMDRLLIDVIEDERKRHDAISVFERSMKYYRVELKEWQNDPNVNRFIREPGHIEFAGKLGLGIYDINKIQQKEISL